MKKKHDFINSFDFYNIVTNVFKFQLNYLDLKSSFKWLALAMDFNYTICHQ